MLKALEVLNNKQKKIFFFIGILIILLSFFEILTFALLQPIINYFAEVSLTDNFIIKLFFFKDLSIYNLLTLFFIFFVLRGLMSIFISFVKHKFIKSINDFLCNKILTNYLYKDYIFFLQNKNSDMISVIINEVEKFSYRLIDNSINLFTEIFIVSAILLFLIINYFEQTIILSILTFLFFGLFYYFFKSRFKKLGHIKSLEDSKKIEDLQNSFYGIQIIKLENLEKIFLHNFKKSTEGSSDAQFHLGFMSELPKPLIELIVLTIGAFMFGVSLLYFDTSNKQILSTLGIFVVAMFRLLPSTNKIIGSLNAIKFYSSSSKIINTELKKFNSQLLKRKNFNEEMGHLSLFKRNIRLENINFIYPLKNKKILNNLNLTISKNQMLAILGANGSGKSTLLNIFSHLLKPCSGKILVDDKVLTDEEINLFQKKISFVQQKTVLINNSLLNNITLGNNFNENNRDELMHLENILNNCNLKKFIDNLPNGLNTLVGDMGKNLSGGEMQKISIARALYKKSDILVLDEATSALDDEAESEIIKTILKLKGLITILIVTHKKNILEHCDEVFNLDNLQDTY